MDKEYSGNMIVELMATVGKIVPQIRNGSCVDAGQRAAVNLLRHAILSNGRETTPLKSAWLNMIDQCLADNPSLKLILAAMEEVDWLSPANSKAIGIHPYLKRAGPPKIRSRKR